MAAGSTYTPIATTTLGSAQSSVTFSSLGSYTDLILVMQNTLGGSGLQSTFCRFNGDSGTNYSDTYLSGYSSTAGSGRDSNNNAIRVAAYNAGTNPGNLRTTIIHFQNYGNTTTNKTILCRDNQSTDEAGVCVGLWRNTAAITSIYLFNGGSVNFATGSTFTLYGLAAA